MTNYVAQVQYLTDSHGRSRVKVFNIQQLRGMKCSEGLSGLINMFTMGVMCEIAVFWKLGYKHEIT